MIGIPIRITVAAKSLAKGVVEMKLRNWSGMEIVSEASLIPRLQAEIQALLDAIASKVVEVPFK